ncbi:ABC transporter family substrate-binding protein [Helcobacillus massiliensis]|uniref:Peptide/nickel transport system substrate-binding protein n=2 Tax=Helcobacillus massiliensis TaxID=521392 RepID=A0A839QRJ3_9MICO|nr:MULTISPECIES: ABC transporter family substrate-binding protein [Helcobacillus]MBB3023093.1 peptide/nickel transport system substrate-binding protein [Helcobacillus massiliensis]MCG7426106.1 ABC transporter family substrate-binding protein [Helcobacillus sp. ACRRO]MCT1558728.1 ABC transporter family substrate-binding protein [Helcobacillus massiliensis]MCT2037454.1 ABC transporter family substrate-binding protein [Helcobacillus massiliensis]
MKISTNRRLFLQGTAVTGVAAAVAGCSQKTSEQQAEEAKKDNEKKAKEQAELPSTAWEKVEYADVKDGGSLSMAISQIPANWNNSHPDGNEVSLTTIMGPLGDNNGIAVLEDGKLEFRPEYIESAEITSEDPQIVTVKYNKDAKWDDGKPVTTKDYAAYAKAMSGKDEAYTVTSTQGWELIKEVRPKGDFEMEVEFESSFPDWMAFLYPGMQEEVAKDPKKWNEGHISEPMPGKGPFKIANLDKNGGVVTLERNDKWWGEKAKLDKIIFRVVTQQNAPQAFANGEIDMIDIADGDTYGQAKGRKDADIQKSNGLTWTHLTINTKSAEGALGDIKVREAIFKAVNRDAVGRAVVGPLDAPVVLANNYIFMPGQEGYEDSFGGSLDAPDAAAAEKVLQDAGYKKNGKVYEKDGKKLAFEIVIPAETKSNSDRASQVMKDLNAIGFEVKLKTVPPDAYFSEYILKGSFSAVTFSWVGSYLPQLGGINLFLPGSAQNYSGYEDPALKDIAKKVQTELDPQKRIDASNEFSKKLAEGYAVLPFYATPIVVGVKKGLVNIGAAQFESTDWTKVGFKA